MQFVGRPLGMAAIGWMSDNPVVPANLGIHVAVSSVSLSASSKRLLPTSRECQVYCLKRSVEIILMTAKNHNALLAMTSIHPSQGKAFSL